MRTFSYCSWGSQGKNTEVVCHSLLQWTAFCQTSPPWPARLGWPHRAGLEKITFHSNPKERQCQECSKYHTIALISHASKVMLKILQARFSNMWTVNFHMFKLVLEKAEEPEIKLPTYSDHWKSKRVPEKHLFLLYWLCQSLWLCGSQ